MNGLINYFTCSSFKIMLTAFFINIFYFYLKLHGKITLNTVTIRILEGKNITNI